MMQPGKQVKQAFQVRPSIRENESSLQQLVVVIIIIFTADDDGDGGDDSKSSSSSGKNRIDKVSF